MSPKWSFSGRATGEEGMAIARSMKRLAEKGTRVRIVWVKAHIGIEGNKLADEGAKEGTTEPEVTVVTSGGLSQWDNTVREEERGGIDLGKGRIMDLTRKLVTNDTTCRTNRGPFKHREKYLGKRQTTHAQTTPCQTDTQAST